MEANNTKPLYKVLDEQRTQGEWKLSEESCTNIRGEIDANQIGTIANLSLSSFMSASNIVWNCGHNTEYSSADHIKDQVSLSKQEIANAQYAALAVNNLASISDAAESALKVLQIAAVLNKSEECQKAADRIKEALIKIS